MQVISCPSCGGNVRPVTIGWICENCYGFIDMRGVFHGGGCKEAYVLPVTRIESTARRACLGEPCFLTQERKFDPLEHIMEGRKKWAIKYQFNTDGSTIFYCYVCPKCMYEADEPLDECPGCGKDMRKGELK